MPVISVIIPCYNVSDYIGECLDSFMKQTYTDFEMICVDDGSTDNTAEIIEAYAEKDSRISLIRQSNQYAGVARNNGMKYAKGEYLLFFDGDDFCREDMLEKMLASAEKYRSDIVVCDICGYDNITGEYTGTFGALRTSCLCGFEEQGTVSCREIPNDIFNFANSVPQNKLFRRSFIERERLFFQDSKRSNDVYFVKMSLTLADRISWVLEKLVTYRMNNSASLQGFGETEGLDMEDIISSSRALKAGLQERGRYETVKTGFLNFIVNVYTVLIEKQRSLSNFETAFEFVKNTVFLEFDIAQMAEDDMGARAEDYRQIMNGSAKEYLFWKMKKLQYGNGERFPFPFRQVKGYRRIAIYGAGNVGQSYFRQLKMHSDYEIVGWYDAKAAMLKDLEGLVSAPEAIVPGKAEKIVIAIEEKKTAVAVREFLLAKGIDERTVVWMP